MPKTKNNSGLTNLFSESRRQYEQYLGFQTSIQDRLSNTRKAINEGIESLSKRGNASLRYTLQSAANGSTSNMDSSTRKNMKSFYYRQDRKARGMSAG